MTAHEILKVCSNLHVVLFLQGAEVIVHGAAWDHANARATEEAKKPGCVLIHPFDDPDIW